MHINTHHPGSPDFLPRLTHDNYFADYDTAQEVIDAYEFVQAQLNASRARLRDVLADLPDALTAFDNYAHDLLSDVFGRRVDDAREFVEVADA